MNKYLRYKILTDIVRNLSEEDRAYLTNREIFNSLERQEKQMGDLSKRIGEHPFASDLLANVAGNYITNGITWVLKALSKRI